MTTVTSCDGTAIAFDSKGAGPSVVLVDGPFCARGFGPNRSLTGPLTAHFTVFTYDRRGRGDSGDVTPYAVEREVEDLQAVICAAGGTAFVYGHSTGAVLALEGARQGLAISRLALHEPPFVVDDWRPPVPAKYPAHLARLLSHGRRGDAVELFMTTTLGMPAGFAAPLRRTPLWPALEMTAHTLVYDAMVMGETQSGRPLPGMRVDAPALVLDNVLSEPFLGTTAAALVRALPRARRHTLTAPETLADILTDFFTSLH